MNLASLCASGFQPPWQAALAWEWVLQVRASMWMHVCDSCSGSVPLLCVLAVSNANDVDSPEAKLREKSATDRFPHRMAWGGFSPQNGMGGGRGFLCASNVYDQSKPLLHIPVDVRYHLMPCWVGREGIGVVPLRVVQLRVVPLNGRHLPLQHRAG